MKPGLKFSLEMVDGARVGKLAVPLTQIADWINFLTSPHYDAQLVYAEQGTQEVNLYFEACEGLYGYLSDRVNAEPKAEPKSIWLESSAVLLAS